MSYIYKKTKPTIENLENYSKFLSMVFSEESKFTKNYLKWLYCDNPFGKVVGFDAYDGTTLIGHYVTIPVQYYVYGELKKGLLSLNTAVHPNYQGKGLFTTLANKTYEEAVLMGFEFVVGVANQNSTYGFVKKLKFNLITPLDVKIGIGRFSIVNNNDFNLFPDRNEDFYKWRIQNPSGCYFKNKNTITTPTDKFGIHAQITSFYNENKLFDYLKPQKGLFKLIIGKGLFSKQKGLFFDLPSFLKPSPLNLIFRDLTGKIATINQEDVYFELIDFDAY